MRDLRSQKQEIKHDSVPVLITVPAKLSKRTRTPTYVVDGVNVRQTKRSLRLQCCLGLFRVHVLACLVTGGNTGGWSCARRAHVLPDARPISQQPNGTCCADVPSSSTDAAPNGFAKNSRRLYTSRRVSDRACASASSARIESGRQWNVSPLRDDSRRNSEKSASACKPI